MRVDEGSNQALATILPVKGEFRGEGGGGESCREITHKRDGMAGGEAVALRRCEKL